MAAGGDACAANGQYLLIARETYDFIGGHAAVGGSLLEDVALARAVKSSGRKIFFRYGGDVLRTRMYRNFAQLCEGWTKNLALLFPSPRRLALLRLLEFILILATAGLAFIEGIRGRANAALVMIAAAIVLYALFVRRISRGAQMQRLCLDFRCSRIFCSAQNSVTNRGL